MRTVHEVAELAGVSVRTLQHYDNIGLLHPSARSEAGYRLYSNDDLARLQQVLLFRELEFPLKDIKEIVGNPAFDQAKALDQQIGLLELKRTHIDRLLKMARRLKRGGVSAMDFKAFDTTEMERYAKQAKEAWGKTDEWREYADKSSGRSREDEAMLGNELMSLFKPFGAMAAEGASPTGEKAIEQAERIQAYISEHFYQCSDEVFAELGRVYGAGGDFTRNINAAAGEGAAEFASAAVSAYVAFKQP